MKVEKLIISPEISLPIVNDTLLVPEDFVDDFYKKLIMQLSMS